MRFGSVCSGIEAASVAWHPLGWECAFVSDIDPFACAALRHHYPGVPNFGDMTKFKEWPDAAINLLVGGTPCQSFSVAGLRGGLDDLRGNLMLTYCAIARRYRPERVVWENVPGVLSSNGGRDFASLLGVLCGRAVIAPAEGWQNSGIIPGIEGAYGLAWRVLDAQYFGVPQRRRRVFVVGHLGNWRRAAAVLFERASLRGDSAPSRKARQGPAGTVTRSLERCSADEGERGTLVAGTLTAMYGEQSGQDLQDMHGGLIAHALRAEGFDASEDGTGRGTPLIAIQERAVCENPDAGPDGVGVRDDGLAYTLEARTVPQAVAFDTTQITSKANYSNPKPGDPCHPLAAGAHPPLLAFSAKDHGGDAMEECSPTLRAGGHANSHANAGVMPAVAFDSRMRGAEPAVGRDERPPQTMIERTGALDSTKPWNVATSMQVRRLTPRECERLQGFPDDYTLIPYRGKPASDGPRYKALGNSMAVPVMRWIGSRIAQVQAIPAAAAAAQSLAPAA